MSFWAPNIERRGRIVRACSGLILLVAAALFYREGMSIVAGPLALGGAFTLYEGLRGWCVLRACKIKTRL